jgi:hypothetical protein
MRVRPESYRFRASAEYADTGMHKEEIRMSANRALPVPVFMIISTGTYLVRNPIKDSPAREMEGYVTLQRYQKKISSRSP